MSVKTKVYGTLAVGAVVLVAGYATIGRGGLINHGRDSNMVLRVTWEPNPRREEVTVKVLINGASHDRVSQTLSPWEDSMWVTPGETITLIGAQRDRGHIVCTITVKGSPLVNHGGPNPGDTCSVVATATWP